MPIDIKLRAEIRRYDPAVDSEPRYETYEVAGQDNWRVLDVIRSIYEHQAGDLAYQFACRAGRCGTCGVKVNGVPVLACQERCKPGMRIEPLTPFPVLRDLVVDRSEVEARYEQHALAPQRATAYAGGPEAIEPQLALFFDSVIDTPTMKRKKGKIVSVGVQPFHSAWRSGQYTLPQSPGLFTMTMAAMVAPRKTSSDTRRVAAAGAARVRVAIRALTIPL